jgi:hypothetical protein
MAQYGQYGFYTTYTRGEILTLQVYGTLKEKVGEQ